MKSWVLRPDYSLAQKATIGVVEARLLLPQVIEQIVAGELTPETAARQLQAEVEALYQLRLNQP